jgi:predicted dehydrogenase
MTAFLEEIQIGYNAQQSRQQGDGIKIMPESVNMYKAEIEEFSQAIIENRQPSNGSDIGIQSQKVLAACYESAKTGKTVAVE